MDPMRDLGQFFQELHSNRARSVSFRELRHLVESVYTPKAYFQSKQTVLETRLEIVSYFELIKWIESYISNATLVNVHHVSVQGLAEMDSGKFKRAYVHYTKYYSIDIPFISRLSSGYVLAWLQKISLLQIGLKPTVLSMDSVPDGGLVSVGTGDFGDPKRLEYRKSCIDDCSKVLISSRVAVLDLEAISSSETFVSSLKTQFAIQRHLEYHLINQLAVLFLIAGAEFLDFMMFCPFVFILKSIRNNGAFLFPASLWSALRALSESNFFTVSQIQLKQHEKSRIPWSIMVNKVVLRGISLVALGASALLDPATRQSRKENMKIA